MRCVIVQRDKWRVWAAYNRGFEACVYTLNPLWVYRVKSRDCKHTVTTVMVFNNSSLLPQCWHVCRWQQRAEGRTLITDTCEHTYSQGENRSPILLSPLRKGEIIGCWWIHRLCWSHRGDGTVVTRCVIHFSSLVTSSCSRQPLSHCVIRKISVDAQGGSDSESSC